MLVKMMFLTVKSSQMTSDAPKGIKIEDYLHKSNHAYPVAT